ncbi:hypothetical protein BEWA_050320 [Theileria equi strain WA]|uniref:Uncharacterized protein n=1 Tax=Theileria equi strain WA TaxID=1537102 RepID=L1LBB7_THEEQ|nr:hypothetical protein BEWA_050320 [Theileria equi strain WA]EKX72564.1 hypothetical protein BEWA_050320 [Theileria equi strain WA]|eukprot:XP_004832016.1 hypothetical protein BEWA_050320 [Theileria equi strain WA]
MSSPGRGSGGRSRRSRDRSYDRHRHRSKYDDRDRGKDRDRDSPYNRRSPPDYHDRRRNYRFDSPPKQHVKKAYGGGPGRSSGFIKVKTNAIKDVSEYKHCTHEKLYTWIGDIKYGNQPLQIKNDNERSKPLKHEHYYLEVVTTYYHGTYNSTKRRITVPLILGIKEKTVGDYTWYENTGDGIKWKKIGNTGGFPNSDPGQCGKEFTKKLNDLTCKLHKLHIIDIRKTVNNGGSPYICSVCNKAKLLLTVEIPGSSVDCYRKFCHAPADDDGKITYPVTYGNDTIRYRERDDKFKLLSVKKGDTISVYYWEGDNTHDNPLLIEVKPNVGQSTWYENTGTSGGKHDKWRKLKQDETTNFSNSYKLKKKLDRLSCTLNNAVRINLGRDSGCHDSRDSKHNNRISTRHNGIFNKGLSLSAYEYKSRVSGEKFSVAELFIGSQRQKSKSENLFFKDITKVLSYASFCDPTNPFIIRVDSSDSKSQWYERISNDTWEKKDSDLSSHIGEIFYRVKDSFNIQECPTSAPTTQTGVQIDISQQPSDITLTGVYKVTSSSGIHPILISKDYSGLPKGFFRVTHQTITWMPFKLSRNLGKGGTILSSVGSPEVPISDVKEVSVYYWDGNLDLPILLEINKDTGIIDYYSHATIYRNRVLGDNWSQSGNRGKGLVHLLDEKNGQRNNAIPINLRNPEDLSQFYKDSRVPPYIKNIRNITNSGSSPPLTIPGGNYIVKEYTINGGTAKISRVTFGGKDTTGINLTKNDEISKIRIYKWKDDNEDIPLLVEFISDSNQHTFFENLTKESLVWQGVDPKDSKKFYKTTLQQPLTDKLDDVSCRVHRTVSINVSKQGYQYCHDRCKSKRIKVKKSASGLFPGYIGYEHTAFRGQTFTVTAITNNDREQNSSLKSPLRDVKRVTVYFPDCTGGSPIAIRIEYENGKVHEEWLKNEKEQLVSFSSSDNKNDPAIILGKLKTNKQCQGTQGSPGIQSLLTHSEEDSSDSDEEAHVSGTESGNFTGLFDWSLGSLASSLAQGILTAPPQAVHAIVQTLSDLTNPKHGHIGDPQKPPNVSSTQTAEEAKYSTLQSPTPPSQPPEPPAPTVPESAKFVDGVSGGVLAGYVVPSVFGGSAATFFGGWKLYNRFKGDPWVRQI